MTGRVSVPLDCDHNLLFQPQYVPVVGQTILCRKCDDWRTVVQGRTPIDQEVTSLTPYRLECFDCEFSLTGETRAQVLARVIRHSKRHKHLCLAEDSRNLESRVYYFWGLRLSTEDALASMSLR